MDKANQLDSEIVFSGKSMVASFSCLNELNISSTNVHDKILIEELLIGRIWDDENSLKYKGEIVVKNAVLGSQFVFPQSSNVSHELHIDLCTAEETSKIQQVVERSSFQEMSTSVVHCNPIEGLGEFFYTKALSCGVVPLSENKEEIIDSSEYVSSCLEVIEPNYEG